MSEREVIEKLLLKITEARRAQVHYFKHRNEVWLKKSKAIEQDLDEFVQHIKRLGYDPENARRLMSEQKDLF